VWQWINFHGFIIKSRRFDRLTYGNNPDAKAVELSYIRKSRAAHVENKVTSLAEFEGEASASAQADEGLVREGPKLLEDKRLSTSRKRQQTESARQETAQVQPAKLRLGASSWNEAPRRQISGRSG
jgi:hypothetical protein